MLHTKFNRYRQFYFCHKSRKTQWQFSIIVYVCWIDPLVTYLTNKTNEIFKNIRYFAKIVQIQQSWSFSSKTKFKFEPVTGSKQKHMAVPSIVGSA